MPASLEDRINNNIFTPPMKETIAIMIEERAVLLTKTKCRLRHLLTFFLYASEMHIYDQFYIYIYMCEMKQNNCILFSHSSLEMHERCFVEFLSSNTLENEIHSLLDRHTKRKVSYIHM